MRLSCLNPLFGGAFVLTTMTKQDNTEHMVRSQSPVRRGIRSHRKNERRSATAAAGLNPLFGGAFVLTRTTVSCARTSSLGLNPLFGGAFVLTGPAISPGGCRAIMSQSPVRRGIRSHENHTFTLSDEQLGCLNPLFGGAFVLTPTETGAAGLWVNVSIPCSAGHSFSRGTHV